VVYFVGGSSGLFKFFFSFCFLSLLVISLSLFGAFVLRGRSGFLSRLFFLRLRFPLQPRFCPVF